jgi:hypothetical protein
MYRRDTHDLKVLVIGRSKPILIVFRIGQTRPIDL